MTDDVRITRIEVIDDHGRVYVKGPMYGHDIVVTYDLQDDGRTLKVFVHEADTLHELGALPKAQSHVVNAQGETLDQFGNVVGKYRPKTEPD